MKIAILTYYGIANYGTLLQAYGLWKFLEKRGHQVEFLDEPYGRSMFPYVPPRVRNLMSKHPLVALRDIMRRYSEHAVTYFNKSYPRTRRFVSYDDMVTNFDGYDAVVVGSDLVWHPQWCSPKFTDIAFLGFVREACKRVSVSPSFSARSWDASNKIMAAKLLRTFDAIGVREESGRCIAQDLTGRDDIEVLIDSALLLDVVDYRRLFKKVKKHAPYIFNYLLGWSDGENEQCLLNIVRSQLKTNQVANQYCFERVPWPFSRFFEKSLRISVPTWLRRICDASFVLTNSFHGTVFSILFHRPFVTVLIKGKMDCLNERALSLLKILGLESRIVFNDESEKLQRILREEIAWDDVDNRLYEERQKVDQFLMRIGI